jgi:hypothetical protein
MHTYSLYIWLVPFFIPLLGFLLAKIPILKKTRVSIDALLFFGAFLMDLTNFSFKPEILSISFGFLLMAIVLKYSWSALKMKVKAFRYVVFTAGFIIFLAKYGEWMVNSSENVRSWYFPVAVDKHNKADRLFEIREYSMNRMGKIHRYFKLVGSGKKSIFSKNMDSYTVPADYVNSPFNFRWQLDQTTGMNVYLIGDSDTLWTLKEVH